MMTYILGGIGLVVVVYLGLAYLTAREVIEEQHKDEDKK